jgi:hypothetical protein
MRSAAIAVLGLLAATCASPASAQTFASMSHYSSSCSGAVNSRSCSSTHYGMRWWNPRPSAGYAEIPPRRWNDRLLERQGRAPVRTVSSRSSGFEVVNP